VSHARHLGGERRHRLATTIGIVRVPGDISSELVAEAIVALTRGDLGSHPEGPAQARIEIEEDTSRDLFEAMWPLTVAARVHKHRHVVQEGAYQWEIDVFRDRDLVLAEVELSGLDDHPTLPAWLAPYVERDVTGEPAYFNAVLASAAPTLPHAGS
jgi:hypothetical protein